MLAGLVWRAAVAAVAVMPLPARADGPAEAAVAEEARHAADLAGAGRYQELKWLLERRVMLQPTPADWLDLAAVNLHLGDHALAGQLLDYIERELSPSPDLQPWIDLYRRRLRDAAQGAAMLALPPFQASVAVLAGSESNRNAAPAVTSLTFIQAGLPIVLDLDPRFRPQRGTTTLLEARGEMQQPFGRATLTLAGDLRQQWAPGNAESNNRQWQLTAVARRDHAWGGSFASVGTQQAVWAGETLSRGLRAQAGAEIRRQKCDLLGGGELQAWQYPGLSAQNSQAKGIFGGIACPAGAGRWQALLRTLRDEPRHERPGGVQNRTEILGGFVHGLPAGGRLEWSGLWAHLRDAAPYSALFGDTRRNIERLTLRAEAIYPWDSVLPGLEALVRVETLQQRANIDLFVLKNNTLHLGLRKRF